MAKIEDFLIKEARKNNACDLLKDGMTPEELVALAFTPQGQEFCTKWAFPRLEDLSALEAARGGNNGKFHITISKRSYIQPNSVRNFVIAGRRADVEIICGENDETYTILVFHGAKVTIHAYGYAVVKVVQIGEGCKVNFLNYEKAVLL